MKPVTHLPLRHPLGIRFAGDLAARMGFGSAGTSQTYRGLLWPSRNHLRVGMATGYCDSMGASSDFAVGCRHPMAQTEGKLRNRAGMLGPGRAVEGEDVSYRALTFGPLTFGPINLCRRGRGSDNYPRKGTMKTLCIALLSSVLLCGCNAAKQTSSTPAPTPTPTAIPVIAPSWMAVEYSGSFNGTNFIGQQRFGFDFCYLPVTDGSCTLTPTASTPSVNGVAAPEINEVSINLPCDGVWGIHNPTGLNNGGTWVPIAVSVSGNTVEASWVGTDGQTSVQFNGTYSASSTFITGNLSFSAPGCGTVQNPWTASFTVAPTT